MVSNGTELEAGYDRVFTVTDYYDGPRKGIANFRGQLHFYECLFSEDHDGYSDLYQLTPISRKTFDLAMEDWAIWQRWEGAFHARKATLESHPALPQDRARHHEIDAVLSSSLKTDESTCIVRVGSFDVVESSTALTIAARTWRVRWTERQTDISH